MKLAFACATAAALWLAVPAFAAGVSAGGQVTVIGENQTQYCFGVAGQVASNGSVASAPAYREALQQCSEALAGKQSLTDRIATLVNRGTIQAAVGETGAALADYGAALELAPDRADIYVDRGVALFRGKRPIEAVAEFTYALSLGPATPERVYFDRAMAREDSGDLRGAYADYRQAAALNPFWDAPARELTRFQVVPARPTS